MTIHAYTETHGRALPGYVNLSERDDRDVLLTVRSPGENNSSVLVLGNAQLEALVRDAARHLGLEVSANG
jgi:hypothetical protein